jgi:hypothetical protein
MVSINWMTNFVTQNPLKNAKASLVITFTKLKNHSLVRELRTSVLQSLLIHKLLNNYPYCIYVQSDD